MSRNLAASIRARLKQHADATKQDFNLTLTHYGLERLLYRLTDILVSDDGRDPLSELIGLETAAALEAELDAHGSLAAAYVHLLHHFDNSMPAIAGHLRVSRSHAYRRCAQAMRYATLMSHIPIPLAHDRFIPGPWRRFNLFRQPVQLTLNFDAQLSFASMY